jgi:glyoxylase-like metal-dependent hydrolase (beta-lactamase superfamily II)
MLLSDHFLSPIFCSVCSPIAKYYAKHGKRAPRRRTGSLALARGLPRLAPWPRLGADRDLDLFARRYKVRAFGPSVFQRGDVPETQLEEIEPGTKLPGGLIALYDGRGRNETPLWLPEQRTLVFADALTAPEGQLRVWSTPWHNELVLPALRVLLELPFEWVIVSHGEPVHHRAAYEQALDLPPWDG